MYKVVARVNDIGRVSTVGGGERGVFPRLNISNLKSALGCGCKIVIIFVTQRSKRIAF